MNKIVTYALAAMAIASVSCTQELYPEAPGKEIIFAASHVTDEPMDFNGDVQITRTLLGDNGAVLWRPNDEVSIFQGSGSGGGNRFTAQNSTPAATVEFKGYLEGLGGLQPGQYYWAIYPYSTSNSCDGQSITATLPANQTAVKGSFAKGCHPAIARTTGTDLKFYAVAGGLEFTVTSNDIRAISIKGKNAEALAGTFKATFGSDGKPTIQVTGSQKEVTMTAPDGSAFTPGETYVISLLPTILNKGITITLITKDDKKGTITSDKQQTIKRSVFGVLKDIDSKAEWGSSPIAAPEAVDLGLSVRWATFNVGATKPEEYGDYFAWGETEPKSVYNWSSYLFWDGKQFTLNITNDDLVLIPANDAAHMNWGGNWRMPTRDEYIELINNCKWTEIKNDEGERIGCLFTSKNDGYTDKSVYFPYAGQKGELSFDIYGPFGIYWSSTRGPALQHRAYHMVVPFAQGGANWVNSFDSDRCLGYTVRAVIE